MENRVQCKRCEREHERPDSLCRNGVVTLPEREVHIWRAPLEAPAVHLHELSAMLSQDERERAARFHFETHRTSYLVGRATLRRILSLYLDLEPAHVEFTYGTRGRPALRDASIHFNLSHSNNLALYAIAREPLLGVDVEWMRPLSDLETLARRFFSPEECGDLLSLGSQHRRVAFFQCWTRKEAYIKAIGDGLYAPLNRFRVAFLPGQPPALVTIDGDAERAAGWSVFDVPAGENYAAAVVVYGREWNLLEKRFGNVTT